MNTHSISSPPPATNVAAGFAGRASRPQPSGVGALYHPNNFPLTQKPHPKNEAEIARKFETLIAATLLRAARAANLDDENGDGMGPTAGPIRDMIDNSRAEAIARAAPLGVARLLAQQRTREATSAAQQGAPQ